MSVRALEMSVARMRLDAKEGSMRDGLSAEPRPRAGLGALVVAVSACLAVLLAFVPVALASGLPNGRGYELVSPETKSGNQAGVQGGTFEPLYALASAEGTKLIYGGTGSMESSANGGVSGSSTYFLAERGANGWTTRDLLPDKVGEPTLNDLPRAILPSSTFGALAFSSAESYSALNPPLPAARTADSPSGVYLMEGANLLQEPLWLSRPQIEDPSPAPGEVEVGTSYMPLLGGTPDLSRIYFGYYGTLLPADAGRQPLVKAEEEEAITKHSTTYALDWGLYEWRAEGGPAGTLLPAGTLPNGSQNPYGAIASSTTQNKTLYPETYENVVSTAAAPGAPAGSRLFFVSPDPQTVNLNRCNEDAAAVAAGYCTPQLYVREGGEHSVLVSRDQLLPSVEGRPVGAPEGVKEMKTAGDAATHTYSVATSDGSRVLFVSASRLTTEAPENGEPKMYEFDLETEQLTYLPGVATRYAPLALSANGGRFLFVTGEVSELESLQLWSEGTITEVVALPRRARKIVDPQSTPSGSVFVFGTESPLRGLKGEEFNNGKRRQQIYRYAPAAAGAPAELMCVSCAPEGVSPSGNAVLSNVAGGGDGEQRLINSPALADEGNMIFFQSPDALLPEDTNGTTDVYEWQKGSAPGTGSVSLISTGKSTSNSYLLATTESGESVFFTTAESLVANDTDGSYDVYDARVGATPPPEEAAGCLSKCHGTPPAVASGPALVSGLSFGAGNLPASAPVSTPKASGGKSSGKAQKKTSAKRKAAAKRRHRLRRAVKRCRHVFRHNRHRRRRCVRRARRRLGAKAARHRGGHKRGHGRSHARNRIGGGR